MTSVQRVIIDVDVGTDDYLAVLLLLCAERLGLVIIQAIFCTNGNSSLYFTCRNLVRLLEIVNRTDIPVYHGSTNPLILHNEPINYYHLSDGFGNITYDLPDPDTSIIKKTPSSVALHSIINEYPNEITIIGLAPLTNLALAIKLDDSLMDKIKDIWVMGGNYKGVGNASPYAEFNFWLDPEAAQIVLESVTKPIHLYPWEACQTVDISFEWALDNLDQKTPALTLLFEAERVIYNNNLTELWFTCDGTTVFAFLDPAAHIEEEKLEHAYVELHKVNRGEMILDTSEDNEPNINLIEKINVDLLKETLVNSVDCKKSQMLNK